MTGHVIHLNTEIEAPPDAVWEVLTDLESAARILRSVDRVADVSPGPYDVGTSWREDRSIFGHRGTEELRVIESDPPRRTVHETTLGHDRVHLAFSLHRHGEGRTKLLLTASVDMTERSVLERASWHAWGLVSFASTRRMLEQDLEDLRSEAEKRSAPI